MIDSESRPIVPSDMENQKPMPYNFVHIMYNASSVCKKQSDQLDALLNEALCTEICSHITKDRDIVKPFTLNLLRQFALAKESERRLYITESFGIMPLDKLKQLIHSLYSALDYIYDQ